MATSAEDGDMVVTEEGYVFAGTRCEELGDQLVPQARSSTKGASPTWRQATWACFSPRPWLAKTPAAKTHRKTGA